MKRNALGEYLRSLGDRQLMPTAIKVALIVGSVLFSINHGWALLHGEMTPQRWISGGLTYIVPYLVNIHGQYISRRQMRQRSQAMTYSH
ncbi:MULTISPECIES: nitrate/nitrite transporter NrtS [Desertifilum]|uniref:Nitrate/nitrite transporter NrtS n=2 Tax=Desertifilum tharense IPPAS B-1220 TaxID=1781255 RepID=A0ACD5GNS2_9CYAN|nr:MULTISPECIES: nitrate/nitrite transporter NrtS [Desertifilum]MDA0211901.1 nitrate/nitrite transporter NrtS [Cyanobacteria bacterium FC1]